MLLADHRQATRGVEVVAGGHRQPHRDVGQSPVGADVSSGSAANRLGSTKRVAAPQPRLQNIAEHAHGGRIRFCPAQMMDADRAGQLAVDEYAETIAFEVSSSLS